MANSACRIVFKSFIFIFNKTGKLEVSFLVGSFSFLFFFLSPLRNTFKGFLLGRVDLGWVVVDNKRCQWVKEFRDEV